MAARRQKIVFLLSADPRKRLAVQIHLTPLLNRKAFRPAPVKRAMELLREQFSDFLNADDQRLIPRLAQHELRDGIILHGREGYELLRTIVDTGRAFLAGSEGGRLRWTEETTAQPGWESVEIVVSPAQLLPFAKVEAVKENRWVTNMDVPGVTFGIWATSPLVCFGPGEKTDNVSVARVEGWPDDLGSEWLRAEPMQEAAVAQFLARLVNRYPGRNLPAPASIEVNDGSETRPVARIRIVRTADTSDTKAVRLLTLNDLLLARLDFRYGKRDMAWDDERRELAFRDGARICRVQRDPAFEAKALSVLQNLGFEPKPPDPTAGLFDFHKGDFQLRPDAPWGWEALLRRSFRDLRKEGWEVEDPPDLALKAATRDSDWYSAFTSRGSNWFTFEAGFCYEGQRIPVFPLIRDFLMQHNEESVEELRERFRHSTFAVRTGNNGECVLLPAEKLALVFESLFELRQGVPLEGDGLRMSRWRASELALDGLADEVPEGLNPDQVNRLRKYLGKETRLDAPEDLPEDLAGLREYQLHGLGWMEFLRHTGTGGILADDMGLGKTFQLLAHLRYEQSRGRLKRPALVVAPVSVMDNWMREAALRAPTLRRHLYHGPNRERDRPDPETIDLLITSYGHLRQDDAWFTSIHWSVVALDEAQAIKNATSQTFESTTRLQADCRIALSGTPIENHLGELWALFEFAMPGFLGTEKQFRETFPRVAHENADARSADNARWLARRIAPFVLRRRKDDVASELPAKTEIEHRIPLTTLQAASYEALRLKLDREIRDLLEQRGIAQSQIFILEAILRLRLLCCDPRLRAETGGEYPPTAQDSAKLQRLLELLDELIDEGRRVLVFSQFTRMLDLIEPELTARGWAFHRLTGDTPAPERPRVVQAFNEGDVPLMLLSLKAGGVGINLTGADSVIHYDPWWNPAVEMQATDRVHRIGQTKAVFVHRLIAEGTVEEKIRALQAYKKGLVDSIMDGLPADRISLDEETIAEFFS